MGCLFTKEIMKEVEQKLSLSSQISISISELSYIEPIKTREQKRIEYIQNVFKDEFKKQNKKY